MSFDIKREISCKYIDQVRISDDNKLKREIFSLFFFLKRIVSVGNYLEILSRKSFFENNLEILKINHYHSILENNNYLFLKYLYNIYEIFNIKKLDYKISKKDFKNLTYIRNTLSHGILFREGKNVPSFVNEGLEFNGIASIPYPNLVLLWQLNNGKEAKIIFDEKEFNYEHILVANKYFKDKHKEKLLYIDSNWNLICNIEKLYKAVVHDSDLYLKNILKK